MQKKIRIKTYLCFTIDREVAEERRRGEEREEGRNASVLSIHHQAEDCGLAKQNFMQHSMLHAFSAFFPSSPLLIFLTVFERLHLCIFDSQTIFWWLGNEQFLSAAKCQVFQKLIFLVLLFITISAANQLSLFLL